MRQRRVKVCYLNDSNSQRIRKTNLQHKSKHFMKRNNSSESRNAWKILKATIFIICLVFFFYQSVSYLTDYCRYPTTTRFSVINPDRFKMPGITFCNSNSVRRSKVCGEFPYLCEPPRNLTDFCLKFPHMCSRNTSNLVIPYRYGPRGQRGFDPRQFYSNRNRTMSQKEWSIWTWDIQSMFGRNRGESEMTTTLVNRASDYSTCYSENLRLSNDLPPRTWPIIFPPDDIEKNLVATYFLTVDEDESFDPWEIPKASLVIHSPFVPVFPMAEEMPLKIGITYIIAIKLVCRQWCLWSNHTECREFHASTKMVLFTENMCELNFMNQLEPKECMRSCKANCVKLKYSYKVIELPMGLHRTGRRIQVSFMVDDPQVLKRSHIPLYDAGDLFSHIGGLMGCWLGVSVAAFAGILENAFTAAKHLASRFQRYVR